MAMNDFEKICKRLNDSKKCGCFLCDAENEYICADNAVKTYVGEDKNKLYKLKGEAMVSNFGEYAAIILAALSVTLSVINTISTCTIQLIENDNTGNKLIIIFSVIMMVIAAGVSIYAFIRILKFGFVNKWKGYIQVAVEQLEKEKFKDESQGI